MIPQEKIAAVTQGLHEAFGVNEFEDIRMLTKGHTSAMVFRIVVRGSAYLLRIIMRPDDPTRHFANMRTAAEAGLAPRVWYSSVADKLAITDFVEAVPFPVTEALVRIPAALRTLHTLPPFAGVPHHINTTCMFLLNKGPALDGFLEKFQAANILPVGEREELFAWYAQLAAAYPLDDREMVSSHCDMKPDNIVFDGHRAWLVDWEAAFWNDRYVDLAAIAPFVVTNDAEERVYLETYFGQAPDPYQLARFYLMRQISHVFYAMGYLFLGKPIDRTEAAPEFTEFHRAIWAGKVDLKDKEMKTRYGRVHLEWVLRNMRQARFEEAVSMVTDRLRVEVSLSYG
jgi:aminoglycoside phosphotransferase (APT) family kinase protein